MSNSHRTLLLGLLLAGLVLGLAWLATRSVDTSPSSFALDEAAASSEAHRPGSAGDLSTPAGTPSPQAAGARSVADLSAAQRAISSDALWIEGRVEFPTGTPRDEHAFVVVSKPQGRFEVDAHGGFRAAFEPRNRPVELDLEARYAYLDAPYELEPAAVGGAVGDTVVLRPLLGGLARVRLVPTPMASARGVDLSLARVSASKFLTGNSTWGAAPARRLARVAAPDAQGVAELGGLAPTDEYWVSARIAGYVASNVPSVIPRPGETLEIEMSLAVPTRLSGLVLDAGGEPAGRAAIVAESRQDRTPSATHHVADEAGRFTLELGGTGEALLRFDRPDSLAVHAGPYELGEGREHAGIVVRLESGLSIQGFVRWPDGSPAADALVRVGTRAALESLVGGREEIRAGADGAFHFAGLDAGMEYSIACRARPPRALRPAGAGGRAWWSAVRHDLAPGAREVVLVLAPGNEVRGRVVDDRGEPVPTFTVTAHRPSGRPGASSSSTAPGKDGAFTLRGVPDGSWIVALGTTPSSTSTSVGIELPDDAARELHFVLPRPASLAGRVLDFDGSPAAGASVSARGVGSTGPPPGPVLTDEQGNFRLVGVPASRVRLVARRNDRASSAEHVLELTPAEERADLRLSLRLGGTVEGRVLDGRDAPIPGASVQAIGPSLDGQTRRASVAADGTYRIASIEPGSIHLVLHDPALAPAVTTRAAELEEGATVRVDFGGRPPGSVHVRGVVRGRVPIPGAELRFTPRDGGSNPSARRVARTDAAGRYEVRLEEPGTYSAHLAAGVAGDMRQTVVIPDAGEHVLDFELGTARIAGRVVDPDGRPVAGSEVYLSSTATLAADVSSSGRSRSGADGSFEFLGLVAGTYRADAFPPGGYTAGPTKLVGAQVEDLVVAAGAARTGVEIRLEPGREFRVRVRGADGRPAPYAAVTWSRTNQFGYEGAHADASGVAILSGLPLGEVFLGATTHDDVLREPVRAQVAAAGHNEATLDLVAGGRIALRLERPDGKPILDAAGIARGVRDAAGRHWSTGASTSAAGVVSLGPLPPGTYRVWASFGPREVGTEVAVTAGVEQGVTLREPE